MGRVRNDLLELVDKTLTAHTEHVHRAINSVLFMVAGPAGNYEGHSYIQASRRAGRLCKCERRGLPMCLGDMPRLAGPACETCRHTTCRTIRKPPVCPDAAFILEETRDDDRHPMTVLSAWALTVASLLGHVPPLEPTMGTNARYLLTHLAQQPVEDFDFDDMGKDLSSSHRWLEELLRLGHRPDQAGWRPMCKREHLVKDWDTRREGTPYHPSRDRAHYADRYVCPNPQCAQVYMPEEYRERLDLMYIQSADRLPAAELAQRVKVPAPTIRRWASETKTLVKPAEWIDGALVEGVWETTPPRLRSCGRDGSGRKLYRVADVQRLRDSLRTAAS